MYGGFYQITTLKSATWSSHIVIFDNSTPRMPQSSTNKRKSSATSLSATKKAHKNGLKTNYKNHPSNQNKNAKDKQTITNKRKRKKEG